MELTEGTLDGNQFKTHLIEREFHLGKDDDHFDLVFINKCMGWEVGVERKDVVNTIDGCVQHSASGAPYVVLIIELDANSVSTSHTSLFPSITGNRSGQIQVTPSTCTMDVQDVNCCVGSLAQDRFRLLQSWKRRKI